MNHVAGNLRLANVIIVLVLLALLAAAGISADSGKQLKRSRSGLEASAAVAESEPNLVNEQRPRIRLPRVLDFKEYAIKFNKNYGTTECMVKAKLFLARVMNIFRHNARYLQQKVNYFLDLNQYTDISPAEFEAMGSHGDPALQPVSDAKQFPAEMPASELPSVLRLNGAEGISMAPADGGSDSPSSVDYNSLYANYGADKQRPIVDFSDDSGVEKIDIKDFYREIKKAPEDAEKLSKIIDLRGKSNNDNDDDERGNRASSVDPKTARAMSKNKISYKERVKSDNQNYDSSYIVSQGVSDSGRAGRQFSDKMAAFFDYDVDFMDDIRPYNPPPKRSKVVPNEVDDEAISTLDGNGDGNDDGQEREQADESTGKSSYISSFLSSAKDLAKSIALNMIYDDGFGLFDEDEDEDENHEGGGQAEPEQKGPESKLPSNIKYQIDWRITGCITKPKSQDGCNACYAFTVVGLMEYYHCRQTRTLTDFSAQYIVDCGTRTNLNGCQGGYLSKVGTFVQNYGLELQSMYPYRGDQGQCPYGSDPDESAKMGYLRPEILTWVYVKSMADWYKHLRAGPLLVGVAMPTDLLAYGGGIHDGSGCNPDKVHAMLLIGSGSQDGKQFWLMKNSFSSDWGEMGYFRLAKDAPLKCFNSGVVVRVDFKRDRLKNPKRSE